MTSLVAEVAVLCRRLERPRRQGHLQRHRTLAKGRAPQATPSCRSTASELGRDFSPTGLSDLEQVASHLGFGFQKDKVTPRCAVTSQRNQSYWRD